MRRRTLAVVALLACAPLAALADTFTTFQVNASFTYGVSFAGQLVLDTTTNRFTSIAGYPNGLVTGNAYYYILTQGVSNGNYFVDGTSSGSPYTLSLILPLTSLAGLQDTSICTQSLGTGCFSASTLGYATATGGSLAPLQPTAATPEPAGFILLGTGLIVIAATTRRRAPHPRLR